MEEIAAMAKVSQTGVSFVLNGKGAGRIAKAKQELILRLAREHNYRPNAAARGLRSRKRYTVGVIMPTPRSGFYAGLVSLLQTGLAARGYMALFSFWLVRDGIKSAYDAVLGHGVDGIIAWDYHACLANEKIPAVIFADKQPGFDAVLPDFEAAMAEAMDYLSGLGHRDFGYIGPAGGERQRFFRNELRRRGLTPVPGWEQDAAGSPAAGFAAMTRLLAGSRRPSAVVCHNDAVASGAIFAAVRRGLRVPEELSLTGFDNDPGSAYTLPPLTTFDAQPELLADALIDSLLRRLEEPGLPERTLRVCPKAVRRESCAAYFPSSQTLEDV